MQNLPDLCILSAGYGSRMGFYSDFVNKALLSIGGKAVISHIIDNVKCNKIIVACGFKSDSLKEYLLAAHSDKNFVFVDVDNWNKKGSGPGYSLYCCKKFLKNKFYIVTSDSLITSKLPSIKYDWIGIKKVQDIENYSTCKIDNKLNLVDFKNKDVLNSFQYAFTGVAGIKNGNLFWKKLEEYKENNNDKEYEFVGAFYKPFFSQIKCLKIDWIDVGRKSLYDEIKNNFKDFATYNLEKINLDEITYKVKNKIIKISNKEKTKNRIKRGVLFKKLVPDLINTNFKNLFSYSWIHGKTLYEYDNFELNKKLINWINNNIWINKKKVKNFKQVCSSFYKDKTYERVKLYLKTNNIKNKKIYKILNSLDWDYLCDGQAVLFHGDLTLGNIIYNKKDGFKLIDWRESFSNLSYGDIYYDFGKLYASLCISWLLVSKNNFKKITTKNLIKTKRYFEKWLVDNNYDFDKTRLISLIVILNMSPLHPNKFGKFLFDYAIDNFDRIINNVNRINSKHNNC